MDSHDILLELSTHEFSSDAIQMMKAIVKVIRARYPVDMDSFKPQRDFLIPARENFSKKAQSLPGDDRWSEYAKRISELPEPDADGEVPPSFWRLARGGHLDRHVVEEYLQLLRKSRSFSIAEPRKMTSTVKEVIKSVNDKPVILPFQDGDQWLFAVSYPDCVHWFDSRPNNPHVVQRTARRLFPNWGGPTHDKDRPEDSGLFMLLGIRLITGGSTHVSQREADLLIPTFRSRVLVELLAQRLNPGEEDFQQLLQREYQALQRLHEEQSMFFDDAIAGMDLPPRESPAADRPSSFTAAVRLPSPSQHPSVYSYPHRSDTLDHRRTILTMLHNAVTTMRSVSASKSTELAVLWSCLKHGGRLSEFHRRYNGILFYEKLEQYRGIDGLSLERDHHIHRSALKEMWNIQPNYTFWRELCNLHSDQGIAKYTLLCALPEGHSVQDKDAELSEIRYRLSRESDPLKHDLKRAEKLCEAIIELNLPKENLMIDFFRFRANEPLTDELYKAFLSLDPHVKVAIAPLVR